MSGRPVPSWGSIFLDYLDLKPGLLAVESKEAIGHLTGLLVRFEVNSASDGVERCWKEQAGFQGHPEFG